MKTFDVSTLLVIIGVLVALTNLIVEVLKKVTWNKMSTNVLALLVGLVLTVAAGIAYFQIVRISITWYLIAALVVVGFMVAYAAMFGFDKLKEAMNWRALK